MGLRDVVKRTIRADRHLRRPQYSFEAWDDLPQSERAVVQICHPDWRGVKTAAYAFGAPVIEVDDLAVWGTPLLTELLERDVQQVVIQGWPPGSETFSRDCFDAGLRVKCVLHSSPALQGESPEEAAVIGSALRLHEEGILAKLATVKGGVAEAFAAIGLSLSYLPNMTPLLAEVPTRSLGPGFHIGVFGEPWWPKNITSQVLGGLMITDAVIHITKDLLIEYLPKDRLVVHGEVPRSEFLALLGSVDLNLYATLTECHPLQPIESYLLGVPCLISPNSVLFKDDPELWEMTVVEAPDEPAAIARSIETLVSARAPVVQRAQDWIARNAIEARSAWYGFVGS